MLKTNAMTTPAVEPLSTSRHHLLCWKSVAAGVLISIMGYMILTALGAGIAGLTAESLISREEGGSALATGSGLWLGLSAIVSLFLGSYFCLRISKFLTNKVGAAHGFVVASVFFILMVLGAGSTLSSLSTGLGKMAAGAGRGVASLSTSPMLQDAMNRALGTVALKSDPKDVMQGLAVRLMQGNVDSAKSYFAYQTGLASSEVDLKIIQLKADFDRAAKDAAETAASAAADTGWSLFVIFVVGLIAAVIGGRVGAQANTKRPFAVTETEVYRRPVVATV